MPALDGFVRAAGGWEAMKYVSIILGNVLELLVVAAGAAALLMTVWAWT